MDVVHAPVAFCETRMRRLNNFGKDDPLYWPQPFHYIVAHLAVLPCPNDSQDHPLRWAWYHPRPADFEIVNYPGLTGMFCLSPSLLLQITSMCDILNDTLAKLPQEHLNDSLMIRGRDQLRKYLERLPEPGARNIVSLQLTCLQRAFLEVHARSQWLEKWAPRLSDVDSVFELDPHVMGAFTDDLNRAADLFRIGIPVWLVRRFEGHVMTKILRFVAPLDEQAWDFTLPLRDSEAPLDVAHADPPHMLVYKGLPGRYTRYVRMNIFVQGQFASSLVGSFGTDDSITPSSSLIRRVGPSYTATFDASRFSAEQAHTTKEMHLLDVTSRQWVSPVQETKRRKLGKSGMNLLLHFAAFNVLMYTSCT